MADSTSVSIGFNTKEAQSEIRALASAMKQTQNEFKAADATLKTTGSTLDKLKAKSKSLSTQVQQQSEITAKCEQAVKHYATAQESARARLEKANAAYQKGKTELRGNSEELEKLKNEVKKAENAVKSADNQYERWNSKLAQSRTAEAQLRAELQQTNAEMKKQSSYIAQVQDEYKRLSDKTAGVQKGLTATGKTLTAAVTAPIVAAGAYAVKAFNEVDDGADIVIQKTGATGEAAKELEGVYKEVAKEIPADFTAIGSAVGEINTRLGFTGDVLKGASEDFLKFARVNKADVNTSVQLVTRAMGDASIPATEYRRVLDALTVASQKSGVSIESLTTNLTKYGAPMRALGLDISDSIALFAAWEKSGVNTEIAFSGMKKAISNWGKAGKDSRVEFQKAMQEIKDAPDIAAATTKAIEIFGAKAGPDLADAIKGGRFEVAEYMAALENAGGTVESTYNEIIDGADESKLALQKGKVALAETGEKILVAAAPAITTLADTVTGLLNAFNNLDEGTQQNIMRLLLFAATLGPVCSIASKGISVFNGFAAAGKTLVKMLGSGVTAAAEAGAAATEMGAAGTAAAAGSLELLGALAPLAIGIGGVTAAVLIGKAAYDAWYDSQYRWSKGLSDTHKEVEKSVDGYKKITQLQSEMKSLKLIIENPDSSKSEVEAAKSRLEEIKKLLKEEYNLDINVDNTELDKAVENIRVIQKNEMTRALNDEKRKMSNLYDKASSFRSNKNAYTEADDLHTFYDSLLTAVDTLNSEHKGDLTPEYRAGMEEIKKALEKKIGHEVENVGVAIDEGYKESKENLQRLSDQKAAYDEYVAIAESTANKLTEVIRSSASVGDSATVRSSLEEMGEYIRFAKLDIEGYAEAAAEAMNGIDFDTALSRGGEALANFMRDYQTAMHEFGASAEETSVGAALMQKGFKSISEAASAGELDDLISKANELGHSMGEIPDGKHIDISAEGDISLIDDTTGKIEKIQSDNIVVSVDAEGNISVLDETTDKIQNLNGLGDVHIQVNSDGNIEILDEAEQKVAEIDGESGEITVNGEYPGAAEIEQALKDKDNVENKETDLKVNGEYNGEEKIAQALKDQDRLRNKKVTYEVTYKQNGTPPAALHEAAGTQNFEGGYAMINDQKGVADPRELVEHKGKLYLFDGRDVVLPLDKGDKIYTAAQTQKMLKDLPHFATGSNNKAFTSAKSDFEYRQKTSVVPDSEALLWWKQVLEDYADDWEVVREANIEIYELTNKINDDAIKDYKKRISNQEKTSKDWIDYEVKMHNLSTDEQIAAYGRMDDNYLATLQEMIANTDMTAEELQEVWDDYYDTIRKHEMTVADLRKQKLKELHQESLSYIEERTYYNDWQEWGDTPEAAYDRMKERYLAALNEGKISEQEYNELLTEAGQQLYEGRLANSQKYLEQQYKWGAITEEQYRAGLQRVKDYTEDYFKKGLISGKFYYEALDDANNALFDNATASLQAYVNEYYEQQKKMLSARRAEIEAEYTAQEDAEKKADRKKELSDLLAAEKKYQNAVTIEGKKKLEEIRSNIDSIHKEEQREAREAEKKQRLSDLDEENERLEAEQEQSIKGISKYTAQALGIISGGNDEMVRKFNAVVEGYNKQQEQLAKTGFENISRIVDMTNTKLAEIGQSMQNAPVRGGDINFEVNQTFHQNITDETTAIAYGKYAGAAVRNLNVGDIALGRWDI